MINQSFLINMYLITISMLTALSSAVHILTLEETICLDKFCTLMFRLGPALMNNSKELLEEATLFISLFFFLCPLFPLTQLLHLVCSTVLFISFLF
ncbi:hypothetical protein AAZV13_14G178200 [Glycine max]